MLGHNPFLDDVRPNAHQICAVQLEKAESLLNQHKRTYLKVQRSTNHLRWTSRPSSSSATSEASRQAGKSERKKWWLVLGLYYPILLGISNNPIGESYQPTLRTDVNARPHLVGHDAAPCLSRPQPFPVLADVQEIFRLCTELSQTAIPALFQCRENALQPRLACHIPGVKDVNVHGCRSISPSRLVLRKVRLTWTLTSPPTPPHPTQDGDVASACVASWHER